jgi:hypothetical protein
MVSKRQLFHDYYTLARREGIHVFKGNGPHRDRYRFRGDAMEHSIVVRVDLNNYSRWAVDQTVSSRVDLAEDFLSKMVEALNRFGGLIQHDDGDAICVIFSEYFSPGIGFMEVFGLCHHVIKDSYGFDGLSARAVIAAGPLTYYQRPHEIESSDWSAEGTPLSRALVLSQVVCERPCIYLYANDYELVGKEVRNNLIHRPGLTRIKSRILLPKHAGKERKVQ